MKPEWQQSSVYPVPPLSMMAIDLRIAASVWIHFPNQHQKRKAFPAIEFLETVLEDAFGFEFAVVDDLDQNVLGETDPSARALRLSEQTMSGVERRDPRSLFTVAHEIGHVVLHSSVYRSTFKEYGLQPMRLRENLKPFEDPEWQANYAAGAILLPREHAKYYWNQRKIRDVQFFCERFNISRECGLRRLEQLKLV